MKRITVIGGGASGIVAAIAAARVKDTRVCILEHKDRIGKKLLATGNGRCNLTNEYMALCCYHSEEMTGVEKILSQFGYEDTLRFFTDLGLVTKSRGGYIYPRCDQASAVLALLDAELARLGVDIRTGIHVTGLRHDKKGFAIAAGDQMFRADRVILSGGGKASRVLGSDGSAYDLAVSMGHSLVPVVPALVQLKVSGHPFAKAGGVRTDAQVTAYADGNMLASDAGEVQITGYGISGIPVFQISRHIARALYDRKQTEVEIDFFPDMDEAAFEQLLAERFGRQKELEASAQLRGIFHEKLLPALFKLSHIRMQEKAGDLSVSDIKRLARQCKHTILAISDTNGFDNAQVCAGGVDLKEISWTTMESRYVRGLYLTGELLDADGICGGYNLQWAFATGWLAGCRAAADRSVTG